MPVDSSLNAPGLHDDSEWERFWQDTLGGEQISVLKEIDATSSISPMGTLV